MKRSISILVGIIIVSTSTFAQTIADASQAPAVPVEFVMKGRQAVTDYLVDQVNWVSVNFTGASIVGFQSSFLDTNTLFNQGYIHKGSFSELSDAVAKTPFSAQVVPRPEGFYDITAEIKFIDLNSKILLQGNGYLDINGMKGDGHIDTSFNPWVMINPYISIKFSNPINAAKWVGRNWATPQDFYPNYDNASIITVPSSILGDGYLVVADQSGSVQALDLSSGYVLTGKLVLAVLGNLNSNDIRVLKNPTSLAFENLSFYKSGGQIYGRVPLTELIIDKNAVVNFEVEVSVWGIDQKVTPARAFVKSIYINAKGGGSNIDAEIPRGYSITLAPGIYHIRLDYSDVLDWDQDPNPKG